MYALLNSGNTTFLEYMQEHLVLTIILAVILVLIIALIITMIVLSVVYKKQQREEAQAEQADAPKPTQAASAAPGTGDVPLSVYQSIPLSGIIIVTTPQDLVGMIVRKAVNMANLMNVPVLGLVENMSYFTCPDCGKRYEIFGASKAEALAKQYNIPAYARMPIDPNVAMLADDGKIAEANTDALQEIFLEVEKAREIKSFKAE